MTGIVPGNFFALVPGAIEVEKHANKAILETIRDHRPEPAAGAFAHKLERLGDLVIETLSERELFTRPSTGG